MTCNHDHQGCNCDPEEIYGRAPLRRRITELEAEVARLTLPPEVVAVIRRGLTKRDCTNTDCSYCKTLPLFNIAYPPT